MNEKTVIINDLFTTTWYGVRKNKVIDQVFKKRPFFNMMLEKGRIKERVPDGTHFEIAVRYDNQDQNIQYFGRGAKFGRAEKQHLTNLIYEVRNLGTSIVRYKDDDLKNRGEAKILSYIDEKIEATKDSLRETFETDLLNDKSATNPLAFFGLDRLIPEDPTTGTIAGLDRSTSTWMRNQTQDFTGKATEDDLLDYMTTVYNKCSEFAGGTQAAPNIILTSRRVYQDLERIGRIMQMIETNKTERVSFGFGDILFKNVEVFWSPFITEGRMYFLNLETLEFAYDPSCWFDMTNWKEGPDEIDQVAQVLCRGNFICTNFQKNGVIFDISPTSV